MAGLLPAWIDHIVCGYYMNDEFGSAASPDGRAELVPARLDRFTITLYAVIKVRTLASRFFQAGSGSPRERIHVSFGRVLASMNIEAAREQMIEQQVRTWDVLDPRVLE